MLALRPASHPARDVLASAGFAWWYLDLVDEHGDGVVLIWSFGLPFIPGRGAAGGRPSLNVAVYARGRQVFYALHEPATASWDGSRFDFGRCTITSTIENDRFAVRAHLDATVGGARLRGRVEAAGRIFAVEPDRSADHTWSPIGWGTGSAELESEGVRFAVRGRAYHDRNASTLPLADIGIRAWWWGRVALPEGDLVFYRLEGNDRRVRDLVLGGSGPIEPEAERSTAYGLRWPERLRIGGHVVELGPVVDQSPFYLRLLARSGAARGFAEILRVDRLGWRIHAPFVRMVVDREAGPNSAWLPLFSGPRRGRWSRLAKWWAS